MNRQCRPPAQRLHTCWLSQSLLMTWCLSLTVGHANSILCWEVITRNRMALRKLLLSVSAHKKSNMQRSEYLVKHRPTVQTKQLWWGWKGIVLTNHQQDSASMFPNKSLDISLHRDGQSWLLQPPPSPITWGNILRMASGLAGKAGGAEIMGPVLSAGPEPPAQHDHHHHHHHLGQNFNPKLG